MQSNIIKVIKSSPIDYIKKIKYFDRYQNHRKYTESILNMYGFIGVAFAGGMYFTLDKNMQTMKEELNEKIDKTSSELNAKIDKTSSELNAKIDKNNTKIDTMNDMMKRFIYLSNPKVADKVIYGD